VGSVPKKEACLVIIYGTDLGRRVALSRAPLTVGRSSKSDLAIDQESISRQHARITYGAGRFHLTDLRSKNGTYLNDILITEATLNHGDQIKLGRSILKFMSGDHIEAHYHEEIYRLVTVDGLTQIYNKRYFTEVLEREWNRAVRYRRDLSLVLFNVDHFKTINDDFGSVAGDSVLRQLASAVKQKLREQDIFARVGAEEFAVLLPEVSLDGAHIAADKIRQIVETGAFAFEEQHIACTVSLGCATSGEKAEARELHAAAIAALSRAEKRGKNRVEDE
jgi:two-component system cell cycle response regulator